MTPSELSVLVLEDNDFQRDMILQMLAAQGVTKLSSAGEGKQALSILRDKKTPPVSIVICDLGLPEMDGLEFMRHVSEEQLDVAIIIISSLGNKLLVSAERMAKMLGIRLLGVVDKPLTPERLQSLFARYTRSESRWQPDPNATVFSIEEILEGLQSQAFVAYFQPQLDFKTGALVGAEALARWLHPTMGEVGPYAFIPLLEQHGAIDILTMAMLAQAAAFCRTLHNQGIMIRISVNLSSHSLSDTSLASRILQLVQDAGVEPRYILLEITESAAMTHLAYALENLARLCMQGFHLSIDDYGTGYSSMQQLTRVAYSELKIDRSFISEFLDNPVLRIAVDSSLEIARKLDLSTVAEGVETQRQWDVLKAMECDTAQGYFIAKPMNQAAFLEYAQALTCRDVALVKEKVMLDNPSILVIDDDSFSRDTVCRIIAKAGWDYAQAEDPSAARRLLAEQRFSCIILDYQLPEVDGLSFLRELTSLPQPQASVVMLTAEGSEMVAVAALQQGAADYLPKAFLTPDSLTRVIQGAMDKRRLTQELRQAQEQLARMAMYDSLTDLGNQRLFMRDLSRAIAIAERGNKRFHLFMMDLDKFKLANDQYGHEAGDAVLVQVAQRFRAIGRAADVFYRLGGDEFVGIIDTENATDAAHIADRIRASIRQPFFWNGEYIHVGVSIGIVVYPDQGTQAEALLRAADAAMYVCKRADAAAVDKQA